MKTRRDFLKVSAGGVLLAGGARWVEFANAANDFGPAALPSGTLESAQLGSLPGKLPLNCFDRFCICRTRFTP